MVERQVTAAQADGCPWPHAAMSNQLRKSSRTPSQISFRTTNDHKAGVCECFERRHHRAADGRNRPGRPQLQGLEELPPPNLRSNPGQLLPRAPSHQAKPPIMANIPSTTPCDRRHDPARAGLRTNRNPANRTAVGRQGVARHGERRVGLRIVAPSCSTLGVL